jgi:hypothetical protein
VPGLLVIPWYATAFRGDRLARALADVAPVALRYGALDYEVRRSKEDEYRFFQTATFERDRDFYAYWEGPELSDFRTRYQGWFQVPVLYEWFTVITRGRLATEALEEAEA